LKDGRLFRALAVAVKAEAFFRLLNEQHLPPDWLAGMIDAEGRYIARAVPGDNGQSTGELASESWRRIQHQDGVHEILTLEGAGSDEAGTYGPRRETEPGISGAAAAPLAIDSLPVRPAALLPLRPD
jgi:hypothetical protein